MIRTDVWLSDPASLLLAGSFGAGALIRLERSDDVGATWTEKTTIAILATQAQYTWWDGTGIATSLYRYRVSNAGNTTDSDYSAAFVGSSPTDTVSPLAYADLGDVTDLFNTAVSGASPTDARKLARFESLALTATDELIREAGGRDYFRHPASGDAIWYQDGDGTPILHVHKGLVSLTTLELSYDFGISYLVIDSQFYELRGADPHKVEIVPGEPYFHIRLKPWGPYPLFLRGASTVRCTGVQGWPSIPRALREGAAQRVRQLAYADPSFAGIVPGPGEFGAGSVPMERWPQITFHFLQAEKNRQFGCWM
jgi:hypothetical protein